jgi:alpha-amylase
MLNTTKIFTGVLMAILSCHAPLSAQHDVMMQAFYWDVPVDDVNKNGTWWDNLTNKSEVLRQAGIRGLWVPSPSKGNFGIYDMGYGIYDLYDLGNYFQKGTTETRFGSRQELERMISTMHANKIDVYADIILNHLYSGNDNEQSNPEVKDYVFDEAFRNNKQNCPYPTNEIKWIIKNAEPGAYYIRIHGFHLQSTEKKERAYDLQIDFNGSGFNDQHFSESEPNNGNGVFTTFSLSGATSRGHFEVNEIDEYKIEVTKKIDVIIRLTARKEIANTKEWVWTDQTNGYYPKVILFNGKNIAITSQLEAHTNTDIKYVNHTGAGEENFSFNYAHYHPADSNDWLGYSGTDEIISNTKAFGNDVNTFNTVVAERYQHWGAWLADQLKFDGFRLDFVRGFQEKYAADWVNALSLDNGKQRFIVGEYWGSEPRIKDWVNTVASHGAAVHAFDFPLKFALTEMCNAKGTDWDMRSLNHAGMIRSKTHSLPANSIVTFLENHDTGKEHDKWVTKDWKLGYAYILTHEGKPCVFYNHFFGDVMKDNQNTSLTVKPDPSLQEEIKKLIFARDTYLGESLTVLGESGNAFPSANLANVYVARRGGNDLKSGAIVVLNNNDTQRKGVWVDTSPNGWPNWSGETLINVFDPSEIIKVYPDGRAFISAPPRGYSLFVKKTEYLLLKWN